MITLQLSLKSKTWANFLRRMSLTQSSGHQQALLPVTKVHCRVNGANQFVGSWERR